MLSVHKTVTVIGATGNQGSGVVAALLTSTDFAVRAVTTDLAGRKAEALRASHKDAIHFGRLRLVQADLDEVESLEEALRGSYGVFLASPFRPSSGSDTQQQESLEVRQGKNLVDAAKVRNSFLRQSGVCSQLTLRACDIGPLPRKGGRSAALGVLGPSESCRAERRPVYARRALGVQGRRRGVRQSEVAGGNPALFRCAY